MGGALGMALGLGLNALGGYAGEKLQQKHANEQMQHDFLMTSMQQNPEGTLKYLQTPEGKKLTSHMDKDTLNSFMMLGQAATAQSAQFSKEIGGESGGPATAPQGGDPMAAHTAQLDADIQRFTALQAKYANNPTYSKLIDSHLKELQEQRRQLSGQQFTAGQEAKKEQATQGRFEQEQKTKQTEFAQHREDIAATREATASYRDAELQIKKANEDAAKATREATAQAKQAKTEEDRKAAIDKGVAALTKGGTDFIEKFGKLTDDQKNTQGPVVTDLNKQRITFHQTHPGSGAPTLLQFTPGKKSTGLIKGALGDYDQSPQVEAVEPKYGTLKGASGWFDALGNFYADPDASPSK